MSPAARRATATAIAIMFPRAVMIRTAQVCTPLLRVQRERGESAPERGGERGRERVLRGLARAPHDAVCEIEEVKCV